MLSNSRVSSKSNKDIRFETSRSKRQNGTHVFGAGKSPNDSNRHSFFSWPSVVLCSLVLFQLMIRGSEANSMSLNKCMSDGFPSGLCYCLQAGWPYKTCSSQFYKRGADQKQFAELPSKRGFSTFSRETSPQFKRDQIHNLRNPFGTFTASDQPNSRLQYF